MNTPPPPNTAPPSADTVREEYAALPAEAQYAAAQFIAFLRQGAPLANGNGNGTASPSKTKRPKPRRSFADEPIVGMWKDRKDMEDSTAYVRALRKREFRDPTAEQE